MTEQEWLACTDPQPMLDFLRGKASDRKLRLLACDCWRRMWDKINQPFRDLVDVAERFADGGATADELQAVGEAARNLMTGSSRLSLFNHAVLALADVPMKGRVAYGPLETARLGVLRDLFGNPFRTVTLDRGWLTPTVVTLAKGIYDDRAFDRLLILADALEESGCTNADILGHLRSPGPHVRGCWVVDLLLGKK